MSSKKMGTSERCEAIGAPVAGEMGLELWDVRYEKEGGTWFLRYLIDKEGGVNIDDCERFSRAVEKKLDEADPIDSSYCLEVSSPGVERELVKPRHFERYLGAAVTVRYIRAKDGVRELTGTLRSYCAEDGSAVVEHDGMPHRVAKGEAAYVRLVDTFDYKSEGAGL